MAIITHFNSNVIYDVTVTLIEETQMCDTSEDIHSNW